MKRLLRLIITLVVLGAGGVAAWLYFAPSQAKSEPATTAVARGAVSVTVLASGSLQAETVTSVGAQVSGTIKSLKVKLGDEIKAGDTIAEIDSLDQDNAVKSAEASLANMNAQRDAKAAEVAQAQQALDRAQQLHDKGLNTDTDFLAAQVTLQTAKAQLSGLEAQVVQQGLAVESAKLDLSRTTITAPVGGTVVAVLVSEGQSVNAAQSAPTIIKIADLDHMIIKAQISEADVTRVQPGQAALFTILGEPDRPMEATLLSVEPAPDAIATADTGISGSDNAIYYNGLFAVDNLDHKLRIAMTAQVTITIDTAKDVLVLPAAVLGPARRDGQYHVVVYDPTTGEKKPATVKVGLSDNITSEVVDGLKEGDLVITERPSGPPAGGQQGRSPSLFGGPRFGG